MGQKHISNSFKTRSVCEFSLFYQSSIQLQSMQSKLSVAVKHLVNMKMDGKDTRHFSAGFLVDMTSHKSMKYCLNSQCMRLGTENAKAHDVGHQIESV